ncbi:MAG TPA: hypothetical protein VNU68_35970 [Verrucomicrobiae bacterium]|nr:hypothetical protein [Verrucomicrobiae bacterium]
MLIHSFLGLSPLRAVAGDPVAQQNFQLRPGWNAIWLEVQPARNSSDSVFANLPVASVWTRAERLSSVDFIQDPSEQAFNEAGWLGWFPASRPEAFLGNLFTVQANHAYLVKLTNSTPINWSVMGRPSLRATVWVPDSYNLRGLPVDPASPPTFLNFFRPSKAHYDPATGQLQKIYRLGGGQWTPVASSETIAAGEAYWIYAKGASDYLAPLRASVDLGDGLDYGLELTELNLRLANATTGPLNVTVQEFNQGGTPALSYYQFNPSLGGQWPALPAPLTLWSAASSETRLRLAVRRQEMTGSGYASLLQVRDGAGTRFLLPVSAQTPTNAANPGRYAGLWAGSATIKAVSEPHSANPTTPTPTKSQLSLRLLIHVDANGQARLLKEVLQMWRDGTYTNDATGNRVVNKPGQYALLTDDSLIPLFKGATVRDGEPVGRRLSTIGYNFPGGSVRNALNLSGAFTIGQNLVGTLTLPFDHPTNPFQHKFHPDHDNLNPRFDGPATESYTTTRQIQLDFAASPPDGPAVSDFGYREMGGTYRETISGIHKNPIYVSGTFRLTRLSLVAELNPSPTP